MQKNIKLRNAIKFALIATGAAVMTMPAMAQDMSDDEKDALEEIITTGSRIKQSVSDAPRPVTIINRLDIELSGLESVADVIRNTSYNTYGSFKERSGTSFGQIALVNLRGLSAEYTAILINGRRVPGNPLTGGSSVDLNSIPLSAVERVELLTDSASAIYGADAIGGVINIIFRDDYEGAEFEIGGEVPSQLGADTEHFNFTFGAQSAGAKVVFSGEYFKRDPIFDKDRFYTRVEVRENPDGGRPRLDLDTTGVSGGGNTGFELDFSTAFQLGACDESVYVKIKDPFGIPGDGCGFGYADRSMLTGGIERKSTFLLASMDLGGGHEVYVENRLTRAETFGRYAPAVGFFVVDAFAPTNPFNDDGIDGNERDIFAFHRFIGHGNRDETHNITEFDTILGIKGTVGASDIGYDVYVRHYEYNNRNEGDTYVITSILEDLAATGAYDVNNPLSQDPTHLAAVAATSATLLRDVFTKYSAAAVTLDGSAWEMPAGQVGWAAGAEYASNDYQDQYDSLREAGNITGSAGNSAFGDRTRSAFFGEIQIPILEMLEANIAVRYDDYSDFGSATSPQINLRFTPHDRVTLRASFGEGFKAPTLSALHGEVAESFNNGQDFLRCDAQGITNDIDCPTFQYQNFSGGNPDLKAEQSESFNIGVIVEPIDGLRLSVDYFEIALTDKVNSLSVQEAINLERAGVALPSGVEIVRSPAAGGIPGFINFINIPVANITVQDIAGFDIRAHYTFETATAGTFSANLDYSNISEFSEITIAGEDRVEFAGSIGAPDWQAVLNLRWQRDAYTVNLISRFTDGHGDGAYKSYNRQDITFNWATPWDGDIRFGVRNLTDEDPLLENGTTFDDVAGAYLYDTAGRTVFFSYKHRL